MLHSLSRTDTPALTMTTQKFLPFKKRKRKRKQNKNKLFTLQRRKQFLLSHDKWKLLCRGCWHMRKMF